MNLINRPARAGAIAALGLAMAAVIGTLTTSAVASGPAPARYVPLRGARSNGGPLTPACPAGDTAVAQAENVAFEQMAAQGQSMFAASGDQGAFDCLLTDGTSVVNLPTPTNGRRT
ncbi:MAG TPA: hypothetical protein VN767_07415 [Streptosporangiaceae bacterium]|nr:hypothetical protein [Streptosporangiaceae bacterium]